MKKFFFLLFVTLIVGEATAQPIRLAVAGISHGHVSWILGRENDAVAQLDGIYERDKVMA